MDMSISVPQQSQDGGSPRTTLPRRCHRLCASYSPTRVQRLDFRAMKCTLKFLPSERTLEIEAGEMTLLEATREAGLPIASACGQNGACARCGLDVISGNDAIEEESEREARIKERNRIDPELRLACRVRPTRDMTVRATYW